MKKFTKIMFRVFTYAGAIGLGMFIVAMIEYGVHLLIILGMVEAVIVSVAAEIAYRRMVAQEEVTV